jgi:hypothetical protein
MKTNQALIKKEVLVLGKRLLIPAWIVAAVYGMILLGLLISFLLPSHVMQINGESITLEEALRESLPVDVTGQGRLISYLFNYIIAIMASVLLIGNIILVSSNIFNVNKRSNYELFHRTQPVSIWKITAAKIAAITLSNWVVFVGLCIFNYLVFNIFLSLELRNLISWNFWYGFSGMLHWVIPSLVIAFVSTAFISLISALFQDSALAKAAGILAGFQVIIGIFNRIYGWSLPLPFIYLRSVFDIGRLAKGSSGLISLGTDFSMPNWSFLFNWNTLLHLIVAAVFFVIATYFYSIREIK